MSAGPHVKFKTTAQSNFRLDKLNGRELGKKLAERLISKMGYNNLAKINYQFKQPNQVRIDLIDGYSYTHFELPEAEMFKVY